MSNKKTYNPLTMFICTHKPFNVPKYINEHPEIYKIITNCNDPFPPTKVDILRCDKMKTDYGSDQNLCLNEWRMINAVYHMKAIPEYVGICHYRRYFDPGVVERLNMRVLSDCGYELALGSPVKYADVLHDEYDSFTFYGYWHNYKDFLTAEKVLKNTYPDMSEAFDAMKDGDYLYNSAMMILHRDDFLDLCDFNFTLYEELMKEYGFKNDEDVIKYVTERKNEYVKPHNPYYDVNIQSRLIAYLLERYTNTWLQEKDEDGRTRIDKAAQLQWFMPNPNEIEIQPRQWK